MGEGQMISGNGDELVGDETAHLKQQAGVTVEDLNDDTNIKSFYAAYVFALSYSWGRADC
jgi:hypothetical protein